MSSVRIYVGDSPWNYSVACTSVNRVTIGSLCAETLKPVLEGSPTKSNSCVEGNASVYQVYPISRITGEGRAEFLRACKRYFPSFSFCVYYCCSFF